MKHLLSITLTLILGSAQSQPYAQSARAPEVFLIGQYEDQYLLLSEDHPQPFLDVYDNNIEQAFKGWSELLMDIEDHATNVQFDLKGVKLWLNIWFNPDGTISHLAYYPKPNSRNIPEDQLTAFFKTFVRQYHFLEKSNQGFQHSASASFPTFFHRTVPETAKSN